MVYLPILTLFHSFDFFFSLDSFYCNMRADNCSISPHELNSLRISLTCARTHAFSAISINLPYVWRALADIPFCLATSETSDFDMREKHVEPFSTTHRGGRSTTRRKKISICTNHFLKINPRPE